MKTSRVVSEKVELGAGDDFVVVLVDREEGKPPEDVSIQEGVRSVTLSLETLLRVAKAAREWTDYAFVCVDHGLYTEAQGVGKYKAECPKCTAETAKPEAPPSPTCSECSGPLEDGMGCMPRDGRCGSCVYEEAERERKAKEVRNERDGHRTITARILAAEYQRQQGEGYGPGREG